MTFCQPLRNVPVTAAGDASAEFPTSKPAKGNRFIRQRCLPNEPIQSSHGSPRCVSLTAFPTQSVCRHLLHLEPVLLADAATFWLPESDLSPSPVTLGRSQPRIGWPPSGGSFLRPSGRLTAVGPIACATHDTLASQISP